MDSETEKLKTSIGEMEKRRVTMEDGKRYLIYYTFEKRSEPPAVAGGSIGAANPPATARGSDLSDVKAEMTEESENV